MVTDSVRHETVTAGQVAWSAPCVRGGDDSSHRVRVVGYLRGSRPEGMDCDRPLSVVCGNGCGASTVWRCKNHRHSRCSPCSHRYRLKVRRIAAEGMLRRSAAGHQGMLTVTAPTLDEHLSWVVGWDGRTARPVCGCASIMVGGLGSWNASAGKRWNVLRGAIARLYPGLVFLRAVEVQERGAIHLHVIVWTPEPLVLTEIQPLAVAAGFGCVIDFQPAKAGDTRQAAYVSKYVTKATDQRGEVPWDVVDVESGEVVAVPDAKYRTWSCSREWGLTMRAVEAGIREAAQRRAARLRESPTLATVLGEGAGTDSPVVAARPPP